MRNNKKNVKGFTLVELIVVIAIIGVLAAILVPSMLGYVKKSKVSAMNSNAKNLYDAVNTSVIEMDSEGRTGDIYADAATEHVWAAGGAENSLDAKVAKYFEGIDTLKKASYKVDGSACAAAFCSDGNYNGGYPVGSTTDNYDSFTLALAER